MIFFPEESHIRLNNDLSFLRVFESPFFRRAEDGNSDRMVKPRVENKNEISAGDHSITSFPGNNLRDFTQSFVSICRVYCPSGERSYADSPLSSFRENIWIIFINIFKQERNILGIAKSAREPGRRRYNIKPRRI